MLFAQNGNRVRPINEAEAQKFLSLGYNIVNNSGEVLFEAMPHDVAGLKSAFTRHTKQISALTKQVAELQAQLDDMQSKVPEVLEKPKRTRNKKEAIQLTEQ